MGEGLVWSYWGDFGKSSVYGQMPLPSCACTVQTVTHLVNSQASLSLSLTVYTCRKS